MLHGHDRSFGIMDAKRMMPGLRAFPCVSRGHQSFRPNLRSEFDDVKRVEHRPGVLSLAVDGVLVTVERIRVAISTLERNACPRSASQDS